TWYYHKRDPYRVYLYCEGATVGAYDFKADYFRFYAADEDRWLSKGPPPFLPPPVVANQPSGVIGYAEDYGIPLHLFPPRNQSDERWTRKGQPARKDEILKLLEPKKKPDPSPADPSSVSIGSALLVGLVMLALCLFGKE